MTPGQRIISGTSVNSPYTALTVEGSTVVEKLFAMVGQENDERPIVEAEGVQPFQQTADLGVEATNRSVIPADVVFDVRVRIEAGLDQLLSRRHANSRIRGSAMTLRTVSRF